MITKEDVLALKDAVEYALHDAESRLTDGFGTEAEKEFHLRMGTWRKALASAMREVIDTFDEDSCKEFGGWAWSHYLHPKDVYPDYPEGEASLDFEYDPTQALYLAYFSSMANSEHIGETYIPAGHEYDVEYCVEAIKGNHAFASFDSEVGDCPKLDAFMKMIDGHMDDETKLLNGW